MEPTADKRYSLFYTGMLIIYLKITLNNSPNYLSFLNVKRHKYCSTSIINQQIKLELDLIVYFLTATDIKWRKSCEFYKLNKF